MHDTAINTLNFRDLGGYATTNGSRVKRGILYRSASLDHLRGRNRRLVLDAHLRTIIDLRPDTERAKRIAVVPGVRRITIPLDVDRITRERLLPYFKRKKSADGIVKAIVSVYRDIVTLTAPSVRILFQHLADPDANPLCINCRAGKDRTRVRMFASTPQKSRNPSVPPYVPSITENDARRAASCAVRAASRTRVGSSQADKIRSGTLNRRTRLSRFRLVVR